MNLSDLRDIPGGSPSSASAAATGILAGPPAFPGKRTVTEFTGEVGFPPEAVFPLLCPVREYEWLDGWSCEMIFSDTGIAEENCIFKTNMGRAATWNVDRYEPPRRISFTVVSGNLVMRLGISLAAAPNGGTKLTWHRVFTGLDDSGNQELNFWSPERDRALTEAIDYFLRTGRMKRP